MNQKSQEGLPIPAFEYLYEINENRNNSLQDIRWVTPKGNFQRVFLNGTAIEWMPVPGYEGFYEINTSGALRSIDRFVKRQKGKAFRKGRDITTRINNFGYVSARLNKEGKSKTVFLHRLIAGAFIPNPESKLFVNHKNGIKTDNRVENLEWVSHQENVQDAYEKGFNSSAKPVVHISSGDIYYSISEAARALNLNYNSCTKKLKQEPTYLLAYLG